MHVLAQPCTIQHLSESIARRLPRSSKCQHRYRRFSGDLTKHWGKLQQSTSADLSCCEMLWSLPPSCSWVRHWEEQLPVLTQWEAPAVQPLPPQSSPTQLVQLLVQEQADSPPKLKMSKVNLHASWATHGILNICYHLSITRKKRRLQVPFVCVNLPVRCCLCQKNKNVNFKRQASAEANAGAGAGAKGRVTC